MRFWSIIVLLSILLGSCGANKQEDAKNKLKDTSKVFEASELVRFVEGIDYSDTTALHDEPQMTERMVMLVKLMYVSDSASIRNGLRVFLNGIGRDTKALAIADSLADLYLNNPASPVRDEAKYIAFLESMIELDSLPSYLKERGKESLRIASLNRPGNVANDFRFIDRNGSNLALHEVKGNKTLLIFYDPDCAHCSDILETLAVDSRINSSVASGRLTVLAIYAEGKRDVWEKTKGELPANWVVGYDLTGIIDKELYDLPAMPTLYLLDSDKRVILKDPEIN